MGKQLLLPLLVFLISACTAKPAYSSPTPMKAQIGDEEQAVYAYLLPKMYKHTGYVIMDTTATNDTGVGNTSQTLDYVLQNLHDVDPATLASFQERNAAPLPLSPDMHLGSPYTLLSRAARDKIFSLNQSGWDIFYNRYPQAPGITTLSRVGFNASLDQALVYIGTNSNWQAGAGYYLLLLKTNGNWTIDQQVLVWGA